MPWVLGRLTNTKVESTAPTADVQVAVTPSAYGGSPNANTTSSSASSILTLAPPAVPNTQVGQSSTANATLTNSAGHAVALTAPAASSVTGTGLSFESTTCSAQLASGASCTVAVRFSPSSAATTTGTVSIDTGAGVRVTSFSATSLANFSTATLAGVAPNLGTVMWGSTAPTATVSLRNDGNSAMTLSGLASLSSRFQVNANTCSGIAPGATCSMTISMPTSAGGADPSTVTTVGATNNASFTVNGTVQSVVSYWSATTLDFGDVALGQSKTLNLNLSNTGFQAVASWNAALTNLPAGFTANMSTCASVAAGSSCNVPITFAPTVAQTYSGSNIRPATVSYAANTLAVSGAVTKTTLTTVPSPTLSFGTIKKGWFKSLPVTVTNSGAAAGSLAYTLNQTTSTAGRYAMSLGSCPAAGGTLAAGASCTISVTYWSDCLGGTVTGTVSISGPNLTASRVVNLTAGTLSTGICQ